MKKKELVNYGAILEAEIKDKVYSKKKIAKSLCISYNTLMERLKDGAFTQDQLIILKKNRFIP